MHASIPFHPWRCADCETVNPPESDRCAICGRHRPVSPDAYRDGGSPAGNLFWSGADSTPFTLGDLLFLLGINLLGGLCFRVTPELGALYLLIVVPALVYTVLKIYWYRRRRLRLSQARKLSAFFFVILLLTTSFPLLLLVLVFVVSQLALLF